MNLQRNVGDLDRIARIVVGATLVILAFTPILGWWALIGIVPLVTGLFRFCPAYSLIGLKTCPATPAAEQPAKPEEAESSENDDRKSS
ncbi:MAG: YgaP family membrane protein [Halothiobacillaceae bacterium]